MTADSLMACRGMGGMGGMGMGKGAGKSRRTGSFVAGLDYCIHLLSPGQPLLPGPYQLARLGFPIMIEKEVRM